MPAFKLDVELSVAKRRVSFARLRLPLPLRLRLQPIVCHGAAVFLLPHCGGRVARVMWLHPLATLINGR